MQFSKPMIELVYEIRRSVPADLKPSVKLANPELFDELAVFYHDSAGTVCKALIKELFALAGDPWLKLLEQPQQSAGASRVKVYRGQVQHEEKQPSSTQTTEQRRKRIYRGRVIS